MHYSIWIECHPGSEPMCLQDTLALLSVSLDWGWLNHPTSLEPLMPNHWICATSRETYEWRCVPNKALAPCSGLDWAVLESTEEGVTTEHLQLTEAACFSHPRLLYRRSYIQGIGGSRHEINVANHDLVRSLKLHVGELDSGKLHSNLKVTTVETPVWKLAAPWMLTMELNEHARCHIMLSHLICTTLRFSVLTCHSGISWLKKDLNLLFAFLTGQQYHVWWPDFKNWLNYI